MKQDDSRRNAGEVVYEVHTYSGHENKEEVEATLKQQVKALGFRRSRLWGSPCSNSREKSREFVRQRKLFPKRKIFPRLYSRKYECRQRGWYLSSAQPTRRYWFSSVWATNQPSTHVESKRSCTLPRMEKLRPTKHFSQGRGLFVSLMVRSRRLLRHSRLLSASQVKNQSPWPVFFGRGLLLRTRFPYKVSKL